MKKVFRRTSLLLAAILMGSTSIQAQKSPQDMDRFIDALMKKMTVEEKIGQLNLPVTGEITTGQAKSSDVAKKIEQGLVGGLFNLKGVAKIRDVQKLAVENSRLGIPLLFGSTGETLTEKSGNLNLGIAGIMYVGGISGVIGAFLYEQGAGGAAGMNGFLAVMIPLLSCLLGSLLMGLLYCFLTVTLRANQNVTGLAMTTFGVGFGNFMGGSLIKLTGSEVPSIALSATNSYFAKTIPGVERLGWFGKIFLSYGFLAYLAVAIALIAAYVLKRTRVGLHLRAVGENPQTADAAGIDVNKYKYIATCVGSMIAGLGGLYYVMDYACGVWSNDAFGDRGWLAIALVIFTVWKPNVGVLASFLFGGLYILHIFLPSGTNLAVKELYKMIPYVVTIIVLIITSVRSKRENQPPASLGLPYFREER